LGEEILTMAVYKDKWNGYKGDTWRVAVYYKDWKGIRRKHEKRGFATKKEALAYEREYIAKTSKDTNMGFDTFVDIYMSDIKPQIKLSTYVTKENIINAHICSYFENKSLSEITANDILQWQNALLSLRDDDGKGYSQTYLRTIQNQLNAIFNHAVKYYDLPKNPCIANKKMGKSKSKEMLFWTMDEYLKFSEVMKEKPISYYAFQILYWTGIRCGDDDDKIRLNQRKPSKYKGLRRFGPEKNLQRINKFMKERPIFYKNLIQMKENIRFYLRCFYCITKVMILQFNSENRTELARNG